MRAGRGGRGPRVRDAASTEAPPRPRDELNATSDGRLRAPVLKRRHAASRVGRVGLTRAEAYVLCATFAVAALIYRPWEALPFSSTDFSEFLPLLRGHSGFTARLGAFLRYYGGEGRFNVLQYVGIVLKWTLFGASPQAWQLLRAGQMAAIFAAAFVLARRLGRGPHAALAGASLYLSSTTAASAWTRLTMGEPLGLLFLLAATLVATGYQRSARWRRRATWIAVLIAAALLTKEMLVGFVPFLLLVAWCHDGGGKWRRPTVTRRNTGLLVAALLAVALVSVPVLLTLSRARAGGFASGYGGRGITPQGVVSLVERMALPVFASTGSVWVVLFHPANLLFLLTTVAGLVLVARRREWSAAPMLAAAASLPVCGAVLYSPWPNSTDFYGLPFILGSVLLLAAAVDALRSRGPRWAAMAYMACLFVFAYSCLAAYRTARLSAARRVVGEQLALAIGGLPTNSSIVVAVKPEHLLPPAWQWIGAGPTLSRYASAITYRRAPTAVDVSCEVAAQLRDSGAVTVWMSGECGSARWPARTYRRYFSYVDWLTLRLVTDSVRTDVVDALRR